LILAPRLQAALSQFTAYLLVCIRRGQAFEGSFKYSPQHQDVGKRFVYRFMVDNPTEETSAPL